jgi:SAM-dependent methyltransferase
VRPIRRVFKEITLRPKKTQYWDLVAHDWAATQPHRLWREYSDRLNATLFERWLPQDKVERLLKTDLFDEATGDKGLFPLLAAKARAVIGVDISLRTLHRAHARHGALRAVGADVCNLPFADHAFEVVVSNSTLDHMESLADLAKGLAELHRVLKRGGQLLLTLDNLSNPAVALRNALPQRLLTALHLVPYYVGATCGPRRLVGMLREAGFAAEQTEAVMHCPRVLAVLAAHGLDRLGGPASKARFLDHLLAWERLSHLPTRFFTGYLIAVKAVRL